MNLPFRYCLITLFTFVLASKNLAQPHHTYYRTIGDAAPPLNCGNWLKGKPINSFKKGEIYVLEFWATWCHPCIASMPHLSEMANTYKNKATFIGISVLEFKPVSIQKIKKFVDSMGTKMNFQIALDKNDFMVKYWLNYNEQSGIPKTFVINENGKIAWIGHPSKLGQVLPQIVNHTWDIKKELANLIEEKRMETLDRSLDHQIDSIYYRGKSQIGNELNLLDTSKANAVLSLIETSIMYEPKLRYRYSTGYNIFTALLATNLKNAFAFVAALHNKYLK
jgi:thiol-disulfide isomerase/thioredoxin